MTIFNQFRIKEDHDRLVLSPAVSGFVFNFLVNIFSFYVIYRFTPKDITDTDDWVKYVYCFSLLVPIWHFIKSVKYYFFNELWVFDRRNTNVSENGTEVISFHHIDYISIISDYTGSHRYYLELKSDSHKDIRLENSLSKAETRKIAEAIAQITNKRVETEQIV